MPEGVAIKPTFGSPLSLITLSTISTITNISTLFQAYTMEALIKQVHDAAKNGTEKTRKEMLNQLRDLSYSIESSDDTVQRFTFSV